MADVNATPDPVTRAALDKLVDVVVPTPVSWVPQTWGWVALAGIILAVAAWLYVRWRRQQEANRYRREALVELAKLETQLDDSAARGHALVAIPALLKRVALAAWPRPEVAALSGASWVTFLRAHAGDTTFPDTAARLLNDAEYRSPQVLATVTSVDAHAFASVVRDWIVSHKSEIRNAKYEIRNSSLWMWIRNSFGISCL